MDTNPYEVLGLQDGINASEADIRKAYRKKALESHPDKVQDPTKKKRAEENFAQVTKAYELLNDKEARKAFDDLLRVKNARAEKNLQQDAKRRKMREDLERREQQAYRETNELESAKARLQAELERLRKESQANARKDREAVFGVQPSAPSENKESDPQLLRTVKASWSRECGTYTLQQIQSMFGEFGAVEDVVLREGKKKKAVALVVFREPQAAQLAEDMPVGDFSNPIEVKRMAVPTQTPTPTPTQTPNQPSARTAETSSDPPASSTTASASTAPPVPQPGSAPLMGASHRDYENDTLMRMREAAERARLKKEEQASKETPT